MGGGNALDNMNNFYWPEVADTDDTGFIYVAMDGMSDGAPGSWNVSATQGPLGLTCDPSLITDHSYCYESCDTTRDCSYLVDSCDWTSCHDDVVYTQTVLYDIFARLCVDTDQVHVTGYSNGGILIWSKLLERMSGAIASIGTVASSPERGFNPVPESPVSIIDFHGFADGVIPMGPDAPDNLGPGPDDTTENSDGYYYHNKEGHLKKVMSSMNCDEGSTEYPTHMDGVEGWTCERWGGCDGGHEVVFCKGDQGHDYPFWPDYVEGLKIMWDFMKSHPKNSFL